MWQVPKSIDGQWFLKMLKGLPDSAGPKATMDAYYEAYTAEGAAKCNARPATVVVSCLGGLRSSEAC